MDKLMMNKLDDMELDMVAGGGGRVTGGCVISNNSPVIYKPSTFFKN